MREERDGLRETERWSLSSCCWFSVHEREREREREREKKSWCCWFTLSVDVLFFPVNLTFFNRALSFLSTLQKQKQRVWKQNKRAAAKLISHSYSPSLYNIVSPQQIILCWSPFCPLKQTINNNRKKLPIPPKVHCFWKFKQAYAGDSTRLLRPAQCKILRDCPKHALKFHRANSWFVESRRFASCLFCENFLSFYPPPPPKKKKKRERKKQTTTTTNIPTKQETKPLLFSICATWHFSLWPSCFFVCTSTTILEKRTAHILSCQLLCISLI